MTIAGLPTETVTPDPFAPATLGPVRLRNRIIKAATSEGGRRKASSPTTSSTSTSVSSGAGWG